MTILLLDVDRTMAPFPATTRLYHRLFLSPPRLRYLAVGAFNLTLMHGLWFLGPAVRLQRRIAMSLFARVDVEVFEAALAPLIEEVVASYRSGLQPKIRAEAPEIERTYILSHCPRPMADGIAAALGFDGVFALEVEDYFDARAGREIYRKEEVIAQLRREHPGAKLIFFADDLIDLPALRAVDEGTLINGSRFSRFVCRRGFPRIRIW